MAEPGGEKVLKDIHAWLNERSGQFKNIKAQ